MYNQILADIANYKIKGAENICKWGILAFSLKIKEFDSKCSFISTYLKLLMKTKEEILSLRTNEVALQNSLNYVFDKKRCLKFQTLDEIKSDVNERLNAIESNITYSSMKISEIGVAKIKDGMTIYSHGHSSLVAGILEKAKRQVSFKLSLTDSFLPHDDFLKELSKGRGREMRYYPFSMVESVVQDSDLILIGCTAVKGKHILCPVGSSTIISLAKVYDVPVYVVSNLLKYSLKSKLDLEEISSDLLYPFVPKKVKVVANEFEIVDGKFLDGVICEEGILSWSEFEHVAKLEFEIK